MRAAWQRVDAPGRRAQLAAVAGAGGSRHFQRKPRSRSSGQPRLTWRENGHARSPTFGAGRVGKSRLCNNRDRGEHRCRAPRTGAYQRWPAVRSSRQHWPRTRECPVGGCARCWPRRHRLDVLPTSEDGETFFVKAGPRTRWCRTNTVDEPVYSTLALSNGRISCRESDICSRSSDPERGTGDERGHGGAGLCFDSVLSVFRTSRADHLRTGVHRHRSRRGARNRPAPRRCARTLRRLSAACYAVFETCARVAELADAPDLGSGSRKAMGVRLPPFAPAFACLPPPASYSSEAMKAVRRKLLGRRSDSRSTSASRQHL